MASLAVTAGITKPEVSIHATDSDAAVALERVRAYPTYGSVTIEVGGVSVVRFVADADQLREEAAILNRAAIELDLAMHAAQQPPPAVVAAGDAACEAVTEVEAES